MQIFLLLLLLWEVFWARYHWRWPHRAIQVLSVGQVCCLILALRVFHWNVYLHFAWFILGEKSRTSEVRIRRNWEEWKKKKATPRAAASWTGKHNFKFLLFRTAAVVKWFSSLPQSREVLGSILIGSMIGIRQEGQWEFKELHCSTEA